MRNTETWVDKDVIDLLAEMPDKSDIDSLQGAACADPNTKVNPDIFYPNHGGWAAFDDARRVCASCVVKLACLYNGYTTNDAQGMRAELTPDELFKMYRKIDRAKREKRKAAETLTNHLADGGDQARVADVRDDLAS